MADATFWEELVDKFEKKEAHRILLHFWKHAGLTSERGREILFLMEIFSPKWKEHPSTSMCDRALEMTSNLMNSVLCTLGVKKASVKPQVNDLPLEFRQLVSEKVWEQEKKKQDDDLKRNIAKQFDQTYQEIQKQVKEEKSRKQKPSSVFDGVENIIRFSLISQMDNPIAYLNELERKKESEVPKARVCVACLEKRSDIIFLPCRHMAFCEGCYVRFKSENQAKSENQSKSENRMKCPTCRASIKIAINVF